MAAQAKEVHHLSHLGQGRLKFGGREVPSNIRALMQRGPFSRKRCIEYYILPVAIKVPISTSVKIFVILGAVAGKMLLKYMLLRV